MDIIEEGILFQRGACSRKELSYQICYINEEHLSSLLKLQELIVNDVNNLELFNSASEELIKINIHQKGRIFGVFVENELIAYRAVYFPDLDDHVFNFGHHIRLPMEEMKKVANFQCVAVHPDYRGNELAVKLKNIALRLLSDLGYRHIFATVSPFNFHSLRILLNSKFVIRVLTYMYGKKLRYIVYQDIQNTYNIIPSDEILINHQDIIKQQELLNSEYVGYGIKGNRHSYAIRYGKSL
jgi:ribosomal protein S18 acetylase RimI-like enzyme